MERSRELYERIISGGIAAIEDFIEDRHIEELFLDFKRSSNNGEDSKLSQTDRKNLAKAISGFGNSEGGVIVWGVDCSQDADGADVAKALVLIENPQRFTSLLQGAISGCTVPPHSGVENTALIVDGARGVVVTHIRKSNTAPHQMLPNRHYYMRAGSDFLPTPHDVLSGMFGRRPQPHIFHHYILSKPSYENSVLKVSFGLAIHNEGPGIASDVFAICRVEKWPGANCQVQFETPDSTNWTGQSEFERQLSMITTPGFRLPPGANTQPIVVHLYLQPPFNGELRITGSVGAGESKKYDFVAGGSAEHIESQYYRYQQCLTSNNFGENEGHEIASEIVKGHEA
ncbi:MAG: ATP-binding protein [Candidatus Thiodiazotropha taylori]|nr:ATP-binding protein [Candidatus Thiodiazotropha endolucinida]MCW4227730.1 ATP-binding protein [Candidatus Thiodiazotropha taylori]